jgi:hypothetical protein
MIGFQKPNDLIPRDTMVMLLKDLTLIESHIQNRYNSVDQYQETMILSGDAVLKKYSISRSRLDKSMDYYGSHQEVLNGIYSEILDSLNRDASMYNPELLMKQDSASSVVGSPGNKPVFPRPGL